MHTACKVLAGPCQSITKSQNWIVGDLHDAGRSSVANFDASSADLSGQELRWVQQLMLRPVNHPDAVSSPTDTNTIPSS